MQEPAHSVYGCKRPKRYITKSLWPKRPHRQPEVKSCHNRGPKAAEPKYLWGPKATEPRYMWGAKAAGLNWAGWLRYPHNLPLLCKACEKPKYKNFPTVKAIFGKILVDSDVIFYGNACQNLQNIALFHRFLFLANSPMVCTSTMEHACV